MRLAIAVAAAGALCAQTTPDFRGAADRYLSELAQRQFALRPAKIASLNNKAAVESWQRHIRERITASLGGWPAKTPLNARVTGALDRGDYRVEKIVYESLPKYYVTANLYLPANGTPPYPAVLGTAGHSAEGKAAELYQRGWIALAKRGIAVLAYDPMGQGERSEYWDPVEKKSLVGGGTAEHTMAGIQCLLAGSNYARYELWDGIRGVDYLLTRSDIDGKRLGAIGNSGGGTQSAYLAAVEPRLAVAAPSCYITRWEKLWFDPGPQDAEQNFAGFLRDGLDFGDFLIAFAPKPILMLTAIQDFFPIDGARATYVDVKQVFEAIDAPGKAGYFEYDDKHGWSQPRREATYRWLSQWLLGKEDDGKEPPFSTEKPETLNVTPAGQVMAAYPNAETVQSINLREAERLYARRPRGGDVLDAVKRLLNIVPPAPAKATRIAETRSQGVIAETFALETEPGAVVPATVTAKDPDRDELARRPAVILIDPEGAPVDELVRAGNVVMALDPRGWGRTAAAGKRNGYSMLWQTSMRAILLGRTLTGLQVADTLAAFAWLAARPDVDPKRITVHGRANGGVVALYAAALEPRIAAAVLDGTVLSYMEIVRAKLHRNMADLIVPGVLAAYDLPDVAAAVGSRLTLKNPRNGEGNGVTAQMARAAYPKAKLEMR